MAAFRSWEFLMRLLKKMNSSNEPRLLQEVNEIYRRLRKEKQIEEWISLIEILDVFILFFALFYLIEYYSAQPDKEWLFVWLFLIGLLFIGVAGKGIHEQSKKKEKNDSKS